ncbi:hypothetical protein BBK36DRAFT_1122166 [Trichoderma citrinoviride]|uniref:HMG box domain-containing protein n=1 Tax=Trichoderma citrinoviride TaxID=58853 RepID=A0A2T4B7R1_9HYPO|nr:hypothetical protein BBK36DRAFT_1122166 [Trichoderma citrinoviride]PTB65366.1 hypothetical protein BBK36DRAFT_1122166 [Trichoderma citrinoviride]
MPSNQASRELEEIFKELGISQYLSAFVEHGFDTWDTILDIQESDLDALGVKLGHRRKLQRRIANARGIDPSISLSSVQAAFDDEKHDGSHRKREAPCHTGSGGNSTAKRKYRRHPKPDENAPPRPMSAYVLFSNKLREDLKKDPSLSFVAIAKLVGGNWQNLPLQEREYYEAQARADKERYYREMALYKQTPQYHEYMKYLQDFNEKQAKLKRDQETAKRTAMRGSTSTASGSGSSSERMRESESREPPSLRHNSSTSMHSPSGTHHTTTGSRSYPGLSQPNGDIPPQSEAHPRRRYSAGREREHPADTPQQVLPSVLDLLADRQGQPSAPAANNSGPMHGLASADHGRRSISQGTPSWPVDSRPPPLHHEPSSAGSSIPTASSSSLSSRLSAGHMPIHALLSDEGQPQRIDETPSYTSYYVASPIEQKRPSLEYQGPKGYGLQTASSAFQNMRFEETSNGDVLMTPANEPPPPSPMSVNGLDGVNALLKAGEIVGQPRQI